MSSATIGGSVFEWCGTDAVCDQNRKKKAAESEETTGFLTSCARAPPHAARAVSVPEDASSKRFCTVCVRAVKVHRARFLLGASSGPQAGPQERQQLERDAESGDVLRARKIGEEVVVATVDIDLQELVFEGAAVSADTECASHAMCT